MNDLATRMKSYEQVYDQQLTPNSPVIIRVDGKAFHTYTKGFAKPFSQPIVNSMSYAARKTAQEMQGFKLAYVQSDEASFLITDYDSHETQGWFGYRLNKLVSITASMFTLYFKEGMDIFTEAVSAKPSKNAFFDARAFVISENDVPNVFIWRQKDWERNSVQMLAQHHFSQKTLQNKKVADLHEMLHSVGVNWANLPDWAKNGVWINRSLEYEFDKKTYDDVKRMIQCDI